ATKANRAAHVRSRPLRRPQGSPHPCGPSDSTLCAGRHRALPLGRVLPPRRRRRAFHISNGRDERVEYARVMSHAAQRVQAIIKLIWIATGQMMRMRDAKSPKVICDAGTNVRNLLEREYILATLRERRPAGVAGDC